MDEAGFWTTRVLPLLKRECFELKLRHHFERVENLVGDGTPDVSWTIAGVAGRIENKYTPAHPLRATTQVLGRQHGLRRSQVIWNYRNARAGGRVFAMIGTPRTSWLVDLRNRTPEFLADLGLRTAPELDEIACWCADPRKGGTLPQALLRDA